MWKKLMSAILIAALAVMTAACGGGNAGSGGGNAPKKETKVDRSKEFVTVLTGPTSGIYFPIGGAFSKVIGEMGYKTSATATGATGASLCRV